MTSELGDLRTRLRDFTRERDWDTFHTPKNLAMSLMIEAAEVAEHFQWEATGAGCDEATRHAVAHELADVLLYLVRLADRLDVDLYTAAIAKMAINAERYPADLCRGKSQKYDRY